MPNASPKQKILITRLCMALGISDALEERVMTVGEAGRLIRELLSQLNTARRVRGKG